MNYKFVEKNYPIKGYFHLDYPIHISKVKSYVQNPNRVAEHSFFPLLAYEQPIEKFVVNPEEYEEGRPFKYNPRPIKYAGHLDGYIYKYYANQLNHAYNQYTKELGIDNAVIAYRTNKPGKSNIDFAAEVIQYIDSHKEAFIFVSDFKGYFESFNHGILKERLYEVLKTDYLSDDWFNVFKSVTKYGYVEKEDVEKFFGNEGFLRQQGDRKYTSKDKTFSDFRKVSKVESNSKNHGVPQGVPISAVMANVYAIYFDYQVMNMVQRNKGLYRRYSDDFIIVLPIVNGEEEEIENQFLYIVEKIKEIVREDKLELSTNKTHAYHKCEDTIFKIDKGFDKEISSLDYLGFVYDGLSVRIRQSGIERFYGRMRKMVKTMEYKRFRLNKKAGKKVMKRIPHRKRIYNLFTDKRSKDENGRIQSNFIEYVKRSQTIFDLVSEDTENLMMDQIKNRKKKLEKLLGNRIYVRQIRD